MPVTFGCVLSQAIYGPSAGPDAIRTLGQRAEALGFHTLWLADHIVIPRQVQSQYPYAADGASPFASSQEIEHRQRLVERLVWIVEDRFPAEPVNRRQNPTFV